MAKKLRSDSMVIEIAKALQEYSEMVAEDVKKIAKKAAKEAVDDIKSTSPKKTGEYASGWKSKIEKEDSAGINIKIFNAKRPWLTHLLEKGHAKRGGGRVEGIPHIKPAEEKAIKAFEEGIRRAAGK